MYNWVKPKRNTVAFSEFIYKNMWIGNKRIITTCVSVCMFEGLFGEVLTCGLRGEGRRNLEVVLRYGVKNNYMITLESIELSFYIYFYLYTFILKITSFDF